MRDNSFIIYSFELVEEGYSLVEIVIVIAVMSTLAAISIPNVLQTIKSNRINEAKILMDSYASECLKEFRLGNDLSNSSPATFSELKLNTLGYKKSATSSCSEFSIEPIDVNDNLYFQMDFRIGEESGTLIKTATPKSDPMGSNLCQSWAGDLCSVSNIEKNNWDNLFLIEKNKAKCEADFFTWKNTLPSGSMNRWNDTTDSCTKKIWVHKNYIADSESNYQDIKKSEECSSEKEIYSTYTGERYIPSCQKTFYFYQGIDMGSKDLMQIKLIEENEVNCKVNKEKNRLTASNGKYTGEQSSGSCGDSYWICNQKILSTLDQWKESICYTP